MTIDTTSNKSPYYAGDDTTGPWAFTFKTFDEVDLEVTKLSNGVETVLVLNTDYTVSLNADQEANPGGEITTTVSLATGETLIIRRVVSALQGVDLTQGGAFNPTVIENALDRLTMLAQQLEERIARAFSLSVVAAEGVASLELPTPAAGYALRWDSLASALENINPAAWGYGTDPGRQTLVVPARAILPRVTNGPSVGLIEMATNKTMVATLDFDGATAEYAQFEIPEMPKSWDKNTIIVKFVWSRASGAASFGVRWSVRAKAVSDGDDIDTAFGTAQGISDIGGTADYRYTSAETPAVTVGGTPANGDGIVLEIYRDPAHVDDTMSTHDARLHGVVVFYTTDTANDA